MSEPFLSEIKIMSFGFPPKGWALCNGQLLPINQNQGLFSLLGTTYGGDGRVTFGLPNMQGQVPVHQGSGFNLGGLGGQESHTLTVAELPTHLHTMQGRASAPVAGGAQTPGPTRYVAEAKTTAVGNPAVQNFATTNTVAMSPQSTQLVGGNQPHPNQQPYLVLTFIIALQGIFPSQN